MTCVLKLFMCLAIHLQLASPITWGNCGRKKQTTRGCSGSVSSMAAIIAFPVQITRFGGKPDKGNSIRLKMGKPIFSWLIVAILFSTGCTRLAQTTNLHLHCEETWDLHSVHVSLNKQELRAAQPLYRGCCCSALVFHKETKFQLYYLNIIYLHVLNRDSQKIKAASQARDSEAFEITQNAPKCKNTQCWNWELIYIQWFRVKMTKQTMKWPKTFTDWYK